MAQNQSGKAGVQHRQMDFVANKPVSKSAKADSGAQDANPPVPVTSAKAAINALYAEHARKTTPILAPSARDAVNAAAGGAGRNAKSAANLHHGSLQTIQKSIDTSRTSAAALLQRAESPKPTDQDISAADSYDPLATRPTLPKPTAKPDDTKEIPVIRTSLKLGASARPKPKPVILPPNARMARRARPVGANGLIPRQAGDVQIIQPNSINPGATKRLTNSQKAIAPKNSSGTRALPAKAPARVVKSAPTSPLPSRMLGPVRDPQMLGSLANRPAKAGAAPLWPAVAASALGPKPKFRPAPKGYASTTPTGVAADNSYVMTTPPKLNPARHATSASFGVVEDYHPSATPEPLSSQPSKLSSISTSNTKADNTANYSFTAKKKPADSNRYGLGGESPFLKSVSVEKRPLSNNSVPSYTKIERPVIEEKSSKASRKNVYAKKKSKSEIRQELPQRPTVIVPASRRSKIPLFLLILVTIILGAVVGAAAYLCFFQ